MKSLCASILLILLCDCAPSVVTLPASIPVVGIIKPGEVATDAPLATRKAHEAFALRKIQLVEACKVKQLECETRFLLEQERNRRLMEQLRSEDSDRVWAIIGKVGVAVISAILVGSGIAFGVTR